MTTVSTNLRQGLNSGAAIKVPCKVAANSNLTLSGLQTVDGVSLVAYDSVLAFGQTDPVQNAIYWVASGDWQRRPDFDGYFDVWCGTRVWVTHGTNYARREFYVSTDNISATQGPLPGTTAIAFSEVSSGIPLVPQSGSVVHFGARGKAIQLTSGITVDAGIFAADDTVTLQNTTAGSLTVTQGSGFTLRFAGTGSTGSRTIAAYGELTMHFVSDSEAYLFGAGIT